MPVYTKTFEGLTDVILTGCDICSVSGKRCHSDEACGIQAVSLRSCRRAIEGVNPF